MVSHITGKNAHLPILGNVLLKTENGSLRISATNLEIAINCLVRGKVEVEGEYSVPAKLLQDYVSLLPSGKIELVLTDDGLEIRCQDQETVMKGMAASEFPQLPKLTKDEGYRLPAMDLKHALSQVVFAVSTSVSRPELSGAVCYFAERDGKMQATFAATDSYRLAERCVSVMSGQASEIKVIVPGRSMAEIVRILSSYKDSVSGTDEALWSYTENQLVVTYGNVELITRLIEGSFPPYQEIIPKNFRTEAVLPRSELQKAVRAASLFSRQGMFDVQLAFDPAGTCTVQSADQGTGKTKSSIKGQLTGEPNAVTLNCRYLGDGLAALQTDNVRLQMIDANNPVLVLPEPATSEAYRYLVMPIRQ